MPIIASNAQAEITVNDRMTEISPEGRPPMSTNVNTLRPPSHKVPVPMLASEIVRIETAMHFAQVSEKTIRRWAQGDGIGRQADKHAPLQISMPALLMKLDGEVATIDRFREGDRRHPSVEFYLRRAIDLLEEERACRRR